jgi:ribonuclease P protein component
MLKKGKRLSRTAFASVAGGKRATSAHFSITAARSGEGRAAAVVSKKVAKSAVARHRLKRRILSVLAPTLLPGHSFIVYARAGSPTLPFGALKQELETLLLSVRTV